MKTHKRLTSIEKWSDFKPGGAGAVRHWPYAGRARGARWLPDLLGDDAVWEVFVSEEWVPSPRRLSFRQRKVERLMAEPSLKDVLPSQPPIRISSSP